MCSTCPHKSLSPILNRTYEGLKLKKSEQGNGRFALLNRTYEGLK